MTFLAMEALKAEYGPELTVTKAFHAHDDDAWNNWCIAYRGIIVGSELVPLRFAIENIEKVRDRKQAIDNC